MNALAKLVSKSDSDTQAEVKSVFKVWIVVVDLSTAHALMTFGDCHWIDFCPSTISLLSMRTTEIQNICRC